MAYQNNHNVFIQISLLVKTKLAALILLVVNSLPVNVAAEEGDHLKNLSLVDILQLEVNVGSYLKLKPSEVPVSITTIYQEDIAITPARNIIDLINIYVPGAYSMTHGQGPKLGIRGIISDSNVKYILLVNGRNITERVKNGISGEIDQWNLNDIEKIEIIRGPGSVTYGPGAVAGVISITIKSSSSFEGSRAGILVNNTYSGSGGFIENATRIGETDIYTFFSIHQTKGHDNAYYYQADPDVQTNYKGRDPSDLYGPEPYLADALEAPQIKFHVDITVDHKWRWWTRYTRSGQTTETGIRKEYADGIGNDQQLTYQGFTSALSYKTNLDTFNEISTTLSFDSKESRHYKRNSKQYQEDSYRNRKHGYSENEFLLQTIINTSISDNLHSVLGLELSYEWTRPPWGESKERLLISDGNVIISGLDSDYIGNGKNGTINPTDGNTFFAGEGWNALMFSLLTEAEYQLLPQTKLIASFRVDKHEFADWYYSPRLSINYAIDDNATIKLTGQQSVRMMKTTNLFISDKTNSDIDPEILQSVEIIYTHLYGNNFIFNASSFYNNIETIAWDGSKSSNVGNSNTAGFELEIKYQSRQFIFGASHSLTKLLNFNMNKTLEDGNNRNGISYSDYLYNVNFITLTDEGNDLNNSPNQSTKIYTTYSINNNWSLHSNLRIYWGMPGAKDELNAYENAYAKVDESALSPADLIDFQQEKNDTLEEIDKLRKNDVYGIDTRLNASVRYRFETNKSDIEATLYFQNILNINDNKIYSYNTGSSKYYPNRARYTEEPFSVSLMLTTTF